MESSLENILQCCVLAFSRTQSTIKVTNNTEKISGR